MPRLSDSMEEGTVLKWLVEEGDEVKRGEELVEIETDKANMTYEADTDGVLIEIVAQEGDTLADRRGDRADRRGRARRAGRRGRGRGGRGRGAGADEREPRGRAGGRAEAERAAERAARRPRRASARAASDGAGDGGASRPRRSRGGWRASWAWSSRGSRAPGPAGGS